ncbi:MAG: DUF2339 domain-containing protein [Rhodopseudomonas sp.]|nr:DUF2339 domain-containing protein [Rhodopseudomonas sp.]
MIVIGFLLLLAIPTLSIVAISMAVGTRDQMRQLQQQVSALERRLSDGPVSYHWQNSAAAPTIEPEPQAANAPTEPAATAELASDTPTDAGPVATEAPAAASAAPPPSDGPTSLEERFGTQWVVWIGGLALALGAIFLVRYTIEEGLLGPAVRVVLGALFAAALIAAGEWTRRGETAAHIGGIPGRHIPSILTAAGTVAAYATVYAAFALYGFISPAVAFVLLGLVALATLAAALLHGPALAGLGVAGAFVTPALISTPTPNYWALYIYLAVVTGAALALARMRLWPWLAITAIALGTSWTFAGIDSTATGALSAHMFHVIAGFALATLLIVSGLFYGPTAAPGRVDRLSSGALGAYLFATACIVIAAHHDGAILITFTLLTTATVAIVWRSDAALWALPISALLAVLVMLQWATPLVYQRLILPAGVTAGAIPEPSTGSEWHLALGAVFGLLFGLSGFAAQTDKRARSDNPIVALTWSLTAAVAPIAILIALYGRLAHFDRSIPFALLALALAAAYGYAAERLNKHAPRPGLAGSVAVFATGTVAALALTLTFALDKGWLTVALALMAPGIGWVYRQRPLPALRYLTAGVIVLVLLRTGYEPRIVGDDLGATPIFNWLLYGYGLPAASFWTAGYLLRQRADDVPARMADSAAILFTVLLFVLEIRHYMTHGDLFRQSTALAEVAMQVSVGLAMTIGLERLRSRSMNIVHDIGALVVAGLTLAAIVFGLVGTVNPMVTGRPVGGLFFNLVLLGYGIPAILAAILALIARDTRPFAYRMIAATAAIGLSIAYLSLEIRTLYHGEFLARGLTTDAEQYTYSAVWLVFGVVLLFAGLLLRSQPARLASAAVVALTIAKVFLIDMADLTGIFRALSFIGLGVVLVGIGLLYQRLLFPPTAKPAAPAGDANEASQ